MFAKQTCDDAAAVLLFWSMDLWIAYYFVRQLQCHDTINIKKDNVWFDMVITKANIGHGITSVRAQSQRYINKEGCVVLFRPLVLARHMFCTCVLELIFQLPRIARANQHDGFAINSQTDQSEFEFSQIEQQFPISPIKSACRDSLEFFAPFLFTTHTNTMLSLHNLTLFSSASNWI